MVMVSSSGEITPNKGSASGASVDATIFWAKLSKLQESVTNREFTEMKKVMARLDALAETVEELSTETSMTMCPLVGERFVGVQTSRRRSSNVKSAFAVQTTIVSDASVTVRCLTGPQTTTWFW